MHRWLLFLLLALIGGCTPVIDPINSVRMAENLAEAQEGLCRVLALIGGCTPVKADRFDPVQVASAIADAQTLADKVCRPELAGIVDAEAERAQSALGGGGSPLKALHTINSKLMECNRPGGRRPGAIALVEFEATGDLDLDPGVGHAHRAGIAQIAAAAFDLERGPGKTRRSARRSPALAPDSHRPTITPVGKLSLADTEMADLAFYFKEIGGHDPKPAVLRKKPGKQAASRKPGKSRHKAARTRGRAHKPQQLAQAEPHAIASSPARPQSPLAR